MLCVKHACVLRVNRATSSTIRAFGRLQSDSFLSVRRSNFNLSLPRLYNSISLCSSLFHVYCVRDYHRAEARIACDLPRVDERARDRHGRATGESNANTPVLCTWILGDSETTGRRFHPESAGRRIGISIAENATTLRIFLRWRSPQLGPGCLGCLPRSANR